ncbi:IclR family transcriptional regulator [Cupriavidus taiwanensis]|uniref:IclR family transcriptional regulator n=1 Tax=Cupriavidus taiwanensis TaxID=164546 RepID=UPI000E2F9A4B|nr:IclR family transcriptional regulator [Cupriavidus taiwanensis]
MPRKPQNTSISDQNSAPGGASSVDRALSLLDVFTPQSASLSLTEIAKQTRLYKSTVLRLLASLQHKGYVQRKTDGTYCLGPQIARLYAIYASSFSLEEIVMPALRELTEQTKESAAFYVRQKEFRLCLYRVDSPQLVRDHIRAGEILPIDRGAGGRVLLAYSGAQGEIYDRIRKDGIAMLVGDRVPELSGISAPVFNAARELAGAVTLTMPTSRYSETFAKPVRDVAMSISSRLGVADFNE